MIRSGLTIQNRSGYKIYPSEHFSSRYHVIKPFVSYSDHLIPIEYNKFENEDIPSSIRYRDIFGKKTSVDDKLFFLSNQATKKEIDAQDIVYKKVKSGLAKTNKTGSSLASNQVKIKILEKAVIDESTPMEDVVDYYQMMEDLKASEMFLSQFEPLYVTAKERINTNIVKPVRKYEKMLVDKPERVRKQKIVPVDDGMDIVTTLPSIEEQSVGMADASMIPASPPPPSVPMDIYEAESVNRKSFKNALKDQLKNLGKSETIKNPSATITKEALIESLQKLKKPEQVDKYAPQGITKEDVVAQMVQLRPAQTVKRIFESTSLFTPQELTDARDVLKRVRLPEEPVLGRVRPPKRRSEFEDNKPKYLRKEIWNPPLKNIKRKGGLLAR